MMVRGAGLANDYFRNITRPAIRNVSDKCIIYLCNYQKCIRPALYDAKFASVQDIFLEFDSLLQVECNYQF